MNEVFFTTDIILAATLLHEGYEIDEITKQGSRGTFHFTKIPKSILLDYDLNKIRVEPKEFNNHIRNLTTAVKR